MLNKKELKRLAKIIKLEINIQTMIISLESQCQDRNLTLEQVCLEDKYVDLFSDSFWDQMKKLSDWFSKLDKLEK
jgi:hypothetical protein